MTRGWYWVKKTSHSKWIPAFYWPGMHYPWHVPVDDSNNDIIGCGLSCFVNSPEIIGPRIEEPI